MLMVRSSSTAGPDVGRMQRGLEQWCPTRAAIVLIVFDEKLSRAAIGPVSANKYVRFEGKLGL